MERLFLCGHTGSDNHGCEAIVRSTEKIYSSCGYKAKPCLATFAEQQDRRLGIEEICDLLPYSQYSSKAQRLFFGLLRKITSDPMQGQRLIQKKLWDSIEKGDLSLVIGGDTYCYGNPTVFMAHNKKMQIKGIPTVLWCCSVEKRKLNGEVLKDILSYDLIVARETISLQNLLDAGVPKEKTELCCDPAFLLSEKATDLPENFKEGNTIGLNLSSIVLNDEVRAAAEYFIERIISDTDMNICLIPHVYSVNPETGDLALLRNIYEKYSETGRVGIVSADLTCEKLKYIIGKTRFFIGARTHSTIAAYSKEVPTLVLGYSVKSRGIARDLFGTEKGNVIPYTRIKNKEDLLSAFYSLMEREQMLREHYKKVLPEYIVSVKNTAENICKRYHLN